MTVKLCESLKGKRLPIVDLCFECDSACLFCTEFFKSYHIALQFAGHKVCHKFFSWVRILGHSPDLAAKASLGTVCEGGRHVKKILSSFLMNLTNVLSETVVNYFLIQ